MEQAVKERSAPFNREIYPWAAVSLIMIAAAVWGYFVCLRDPVFRSLDQADTALVARNLVSGNGYTTDAIWLWTRDWGSVHHPEDVWPLLQPTLTAASFLLLGQSVAAQMAVNVFFLLALVLAVFIVTKNLFGPWEGVLAALLTVLARPVPGLIGAGFDDIGAAFLYFAAIYAVYRSFDENSKYRDVVVAAIFTGLAVHQKFQGAMIIFAYVAWQAATLFRKPGRTIKRSLLFVAVLLIVGMPLMIRNYRIFGQLTYPSSSLISALGSSWDPMFQRWRSHIVYNKVYFHHVKPDYKYVIFFRGKRYFFYQRPAAELKRLIKWLYWGVVVNRKIMLLALFGVLAAWKKRRRWIKWNALVVLSFFGMVLFRGVEWRYYVFVVPLAAVFAAAFVGWIVDKTPPKSRVLALAVPALFIGVLFYQAFGNYRGQLEVPAALKSRDKQFIGMCAWLEKHLEPGEGVMSWHPAETAWQTGRTGASVPNVELAEFIKLADRYKLRYLVIDNRKFFLKLFDEPGTQYWVARQLAPLFAGRNAFGFGLAHRNAYTLVYRIPRPDEIKLDRLPKLPREPMDFTRLLLPPDRGGFNRTPPPLRFK